MASSVKIGANVDSPLFSFDDDSITNMVVDTAVNLIMDEMTADTAEITVVYEDEDKSLLQLAWATPVYIYSDDVLTGKFFSKKVTRIGATRFTIDCTSIVGLLEYDTFYGKVYEGESFKDAVEEIITTNGITSYRGASRVVHVYNKSESDTFYGAWTASDSGGTPYLSCLMEAQVTINKSLLDEVPVAELADKISCTDVLLGELAFNYVASDATQFNYGLYMNMTRASTSDPWGDYGEVFFAYFNTVISLGTPTEPTTYNIFCDPKNNRVTINETEYPLEGSIPYQSSITKQAFGGYGIVASGYPNTWGSISYPHDVVYSKFKLSKISEYTLNPSTGATSQFRVVIPANAYYIPWFDAYAIEDLNGNILASNSVSGYHGTVPMVNAELPQEHYFPFYSEAAYQTEILNAIQYAPGIDGLEVYGWMPVCSKREAIHQLMFALGVVLRKDANGNLLFSAPNTNYAEEIPTDNIYESGSEAYLEHTNFIRVTEHAYQQVPGKEPEQIYSTDTPSNSDFAFAVFTNAPVVGNPTVADGLYLYAWNCNAAIVGGVGSLNGVTYDHSRSILTRSVGNYADGRELSVSEATLVTYLNSGNVMDRLAAYYGNAYTISNSILLGNQRTGGYYKFTSPFGDEVYGFLKKVNRVVSSVVKGNCEFLCNYNPPTIGIGYENFVILTGSGTWEVPDSVFQKATPRIRVVAIAGGDGGYSGKAGYAGNSPPGAWGGSATMSLPGSAGASGDGGRFYEVTIENPAYSYTYLAGHGGEGGAMSSSTSTSNAGAQGLDSTLSDGFNTYSSAYGEKSSAGYVNFFTGDVYAKKSPVNLKFTVAGGVGGWFQIVDQTKKTFVVAPGFGVSVYSYVDGELLLTAYNGGYAGSHYPGGTGTQYASGGAGGGGAAGSNGGNGSSGTISGGNPRGGNGGKGADATYVPPMPLLYDPTAYGCGGYGGCGGGGGGGSGSSAGSAGTPGNGGKGGKGGFGADGCILIYY